MNKTPDPYLADRFSFRLAPALSAALERAASQQRRTRSNMVIYILEGWLARNKFLRKQKETAA